MPGTDTYLTLEFTGGLFPQYRQCQAWGGGLRGQLFKNCAEPFASHSYVPGNNVSWIVLWPAIAGPREREIFMW